MRVADRVFARAYDFRRFLQKRSRAHLELRRCEPARGSNCRAGRLPREITALAGRERTQRARRHAAEPLAELPIDHAVDAVEPIAAASARPGARSARSSKRLPRYASDARHPDERRGERALAVAALRPRLRARGASTRSARAEGWSPARPGRVRPRPSARAGGAWAQPAEAFLDQLVTWRELGFNCLRAARTTTTATSRCPTGRERRWPSTPSDPRPTLYTLAELEAATTHDELWNAAQRQLVRGRPHPQLPADAVGQEDPRVDARARARRSRS